MNKISARIIADSISETGQRITSFVLTFPRIILAEFNTHRMLSKNSASSRAIPFKKMVEMVQTNPFIPIRWMKDHKGMQGTEYFTEKEVEEYAILEDHLIARDNAVAIASRQNQKGVSKQMVNRLLEPYLYHTAIVTATDWDNFFALRAHKDAEIHIEDLANKMLDAYNESKPRLMEVGEWHIPFGFLFDIDRMINYCENNNIVTNDHNLDNLKIQIATARCARVSYLNFEGRDDYESDVKLYNQLLNSGHMSPFEHCAMVTGDSEYYGNFQGWKQHRKFIQGENKSDDRVKK